MLLSYVDRVVHLWSAFVVNKNRHMLPRMKKTINGSSILCSCLQRRSHSSWVFPQGRRRFVIPGSPTCFQPILSYLRDPNKLELPEDREQLRRLQEDARFYMIFDLEHICMERGRIIDERGLSTLFSSSQKDEVIAALANSMALVTKKAPSAEGMLLLGGGSVELHHEATVSMADGGGGCRMEEIIYATVVGERIPMVSRQIGRKVHDFFHSFAPFPVTLVT